MSSKFINGYNSPIFKIFTPGLSTPEIISIDNFYNFLYEYIEDVFIENEAFDGTVLNKYRYSIIHWSLDFSQIFTKENALKIQNLLLAFYSNKQVFLIPHSDVPSRFFEISLVPEKRLIALMYGGRLAGGNYGFTINFRTKYPVYSPHWVDPNAQPTISSESFYEFF